jgi:hypothetical protein
MRAAGNSGGCMRKQRTEAFDPDSGISGGHHHARGR